MKQILILLATIMVAISANAQIQSLVTLSHEGELTFFNRISALEDAYEAAVDGDIIYLSEGKFGTSSSSLTINKKITIIGCGYNSHIIPDIRVYFSTATSLTAPLFDGLRLEDVSFNNASDIEIKKCLINYISLSGMKDNAKIDRCYLNEYRGSSSKNIQILNSKINIFGGQYIEVIENCNIKSYDSYAAYLTNCIIDTYKAGYSGMYENCLIRLTTSGLPNSFLNDLRNCYILSPTDTPEVLDDNIECVLPDMSQYLGTDGTEVGIYGGQWFPFSETPTVPTVDSANSSVVYDKDTNKLNVTITVAPN